MFTTLISELIELLIMKIHLKEKIGLEYLRIEKKEETVKNIRPSVKGKIVFMICNQNLLFY